MFYMEKSKKPRVTVSEETSTSKGEGGGSGAEILVVLSRYRSESEMPVVLSVSWSSLFMVVVLKVKPYLPHEWTPKGMLERVNAFSEYYVSAVSSNSLLSIRTVYLETNPPSPSHLSSRCTYI